MRESLRCKVLDVCTKKIAQKGDNVGVSFYAFLPIRTTIQSC